MNGFAASGRIERTAPRRVKPRGVEGRLATNPHPGDVTELVDVRIADPLSDRWAAFRERWSELTFYLFDPQSWR